MPKALILPQNISTNRAKLANVRPQNLKKPLILATVLVMLASPAAQAHPHVWVTMNNKLVTDAQGLVTGVAVAWSFDDAYMQVALEGMDANSDGTYSSEELAALTRENVSSLRDYDYFMHIKVDGELQKVPDVTDTNQTFENNKLTLFFTVPLPQPVDPRKQSFELKVFDPEFYIAFDYAEQKPVSLAGTLPAGCKLDLKPVPTTAELEQTKTMLSTKDKDWKPDPNEEFGSVFAQPMLVACQA